MKTSTWFKPILKAVEKQTYAYPMLYKGWLMLVGMGHSFIAFERDTSAKNLNSLDFYLDVQPHNETLENMTAKNCQNVLDHLESMMNLPIIGLLDTATLLQALKDINLVWAGSGAATLVLSKDSSYLVMNDSYVSRNQYMQEISYAGATVSFSVIISDMVTLLKGLGGTLVLRGHCDTEITEYGKIYYFTYLLDDGSRAVLSVGKNMIGGLPDNLDER